MGAEETFLRIRVQADPTACLHQLEALAGPAGVKKSLLPPGRKAEPKAWFKGL